MCGIAGIAGGEARERAPAMRAMRDRLVHRGPDSAGEHVSDQVALGVRRLRIIDLVTGEQPQASEDGTVWTVFNGEIYNFRELRRDLEARGHRFRTASDTEVIVHAYEEEPDRFVERLDGMFALAVWDERRRTLVLARDRLGKKPLLYHEHEGGISFASELVALLASGRFDAAADEDAIRLYLRLGYVPGPRSAIAGVRKLPPAHVLVWHDGRSRLRRYWAAPFGETLEIGEAEAVGETRRLIERAVARRLVADVPLGAFLSGGVDSSAVVATMARLTSTVRTFTIGFEDRELSEVEHARRVAERFGTEHHAFVVTAPDLSALPDLVSHYGEPYADSSAIPTYHLSKLTRAYVTVALNGGGGDEVFAGYDRYYAAQLAARLDGPVLGAAAQVARLLPPDGSSRHPIARARRFLLPAGLPAGERYLQWSASSPPTSFAGSSRPTSTSARRPWTTRSSAT